MTGVRTNRVTAAEITRQYGADSPELPKLVTRTAQHFDMTLAGVSADKAYLSMKNMAAIDRTGAVPYLAFKINSTPTSTPVVTLRSQWQ